MKLKGATRTFRVQALIVLPLLYDSRERMTKALAVREDARVRQEDLADQPVPGVGRSVDGEMDNLGRREL